MKRTAGEELYPMRTVASLTGVNPVTLRAWERRYALVTPRRGAGGHRLYTRADIDLLRRVVGLLDGGLSIGRASALVRGTDTREAPAPGEGGASGALDAFSARLLQAIETLDETRLNEAYEDALDLYPVEMVNEKVLTPVLHALGERWPQREGGIAEEHYFSSFVRGKLGADIQRLSCAARGPRLLAACMPDDGHDLGLLMFSHGAARRGYRVVVLGAAVPFAELRAAASVSAPAAVVLSMCVAPRSQVIGRGLQALARALAVPLLVGGAVAEDFRDTLEASGATVLGDDLSAGFDWLDTHLGARVAPGA